MRAWPRLFFRAALLALLLLGWNLFAAQSALRGAVLYPGGLPRTASLAAGLGLIPYPATRRGLRLLLVDVLVTGLVAALVIGVSG